MVKRAETKAYELSTESKGKSVNKNSMYNDKFFNTKHYLLLFCPAEDKVSIHKEDKLKG